MKKVIVSSFIAVIAATSLSASSVNPHILVDTPSEANMEKMECFN